MAFCMQLPRVLLRGISRYRPNEIVPVRLSHTSANPKKQDCFSMFKPLKVVKYKPVSHVIMDLDGIVLDTANLYYHAHARYLLKFKKSYTNEHKIHTFGVSDMDAARYLVKQLELPISPEVYVHGIWQELRLTFLKAKLCVGIKELICHLSSSKVPLALVTSSNQKALGLKLKNHKWLTEHFCHVVTRDDPEVKGGKPKPDIYRIAASRFYAAPKDFTKYLVFEDSINGAQSAKDAGMQVVLFPEKSLPRSQMEKYGLLLNSLKEIDLTDFELPSLPKPEVF